MRCFEIYNIRFGIDFKSPGDERELTELLGLFSKEKLDSLDFRLDYIKKERYQEIGIAIFPYLSRAGVWGLHAGGFHFKGTHLAVGPSGSGKSLLTYMALKNGFDIVGDDITLARGKSTGIELLPLFTKIFFGSKPVSPPLGAFKPGILNNILFPEFSRNSSGIKKIKDKKEIMKRLVSQVLWSYEKDIQKKQKAFLQRLCDYPAFEIKLNKKFFKDISLFRGLMDELIQG